MRVTFVLPKPNHNNAIAASDINGMHVDEQVDFRLVGAQSCIHRFSSNGTVVLSSPDSVQSQ
jgi:hypothetical protein